MASKGAQDVCDLAPAYIRAIAPYQPGKPIAELARELNLDPDNIIKLASNENPLGVSPLAMRAMQAALADVARYPDGNGFELKHALAGRYGVDTAQIVLGNGSNDVLELAARAFLAPALEAVYAQHAFAVYPLATQAIGASGIEVPAREFGHDLAAMLRAITPRTRLIFLANPNNPTGTLMSSGDLHGFLCAVPRQVIVVLDEGRHPVRVQLVHAVGRERDAVLTGLGLPDDSDDQRGAGCGWVHGRNLSPASASTVCTRSHTMSSSSGPATSGGASWTTG
jgi:hypothetical protein